jgi:hypothetical protein
VENHKSIMAELSGTLAVNYVTAMDFYHMHEIANSLQQFTHQTHWVTHQRQSEDWRML